jgi:hypothetical protein
MNMHKTPHLVKPFHDRLPDGLPLSPNSLFADRPGQRFGPNNTLLAFYRIDIDDSIDAKLLSIISFPWTPYITLFGSSLRCGRLRNLLLQMIF